MASALAYSMDKSVESIAWCLESNAERPSRFAQFTTSIVVQRIRDLLRVTEERLQRFGKADCISWDGGHDDLFERDTWIQQMKTLDPSTRVIFDISLSIRMGGNKFRLAGSSGAH